MYDMSFLICGHRKYISHCNTMQLGDEFSPIDSDVILKSRDDGETGMILDLP
jgi:hypothetical protein